MGNAVGRNADQEQSKWQDRYIVLLRKLPIHREEALEPPACATEQLAVLDPLTT